MDYLTHHMLRASAARFSEKEALVHGSERWTYSRLWQQTGRLAAGLRQLGIKRNDRIGIFLDPTISLPLSIFGISRAGGAFVPMHHGLLRDQVAHIVTDCGMRALITHSSKLLHIDKAIEDNNDLEFVIVVDDANPDLPVAVYTLDEIGAAAVDDEIDDVAIEQDLAAILYTSGSTGGPKGVMLSHRNMLAGASIVSEYLGITDKDRILAALPLSFDAGLNQLTTAIQQGGTLVMLNFVFARQIVDVLIEERITILAGVPSLWSLLAQPSSTFARRQPTTLRTLTNTGGALPLSVLGAIREIVPDAQFFLMYGLTEAFRSTYLPPDQLDQRPTSIGRAIPNTEILVIGENGERCGPGEVGELVHCGPTVSLGYWGQPDLTEKILRPHPFPMPGAGSVDRVVYSGDYVRLDDDGYLTFIGRRDNMIKTSGFRVSPTEVEEGLCKSGPIREAAVIGIADLILGQRIKAFVVANEGCKVDADEIIASCAERLPRHMIPKTVEVVDLLPKTSSGKVDYPALRREEEARTTVEA